MSDADDGAGQGGTVSISGTSAGTSDDTAAHLHSIRYAESWWEDSCCEVPSEGADRDGTRHALRRQVVFAVCALESWFFEWVRDELLEERIEATDVFAGYRTVPERVKGVMREVEGRGGLERPFECGESTEWDDMVDLLGVRNGLVHAGASRVGGDLPEGTRPPEPTVADLRALAPYEPLRIVRDVARFLTSFAGQEEPAWMELPAAE